MKSTLLIIVLMIFLPGQCIFGQTETYTITLSSFSSDRYDEFSPVFYEKGIVFCTNRSPNKVFDYTGSGNYGLFKIYYIDIKRKPDLKSGRLFSKDLKSKLNDGPVTFNRSFDTVYYSRNLIVDGKTGDLSSSRNKLGIFYSVKTGNNWTKGREFRYNDEWYDNTTPCLSPDGKRLYFASDNPDGFGGSDLYYCQWKGDYWGDPVNLGPVINTAGNESFPYVSPSGDLYFSSDGHPGLGGKDIFFSRFSDSTWLPPVHLDPPINSRYDDFGIITDTLMTEGYFSSNRNGSSDIYSFKTNFPQIFYSTIQKENQYCFRFTDKGSIVVDTANLLYKWYFGDGKSSLNAEVNHCYSGPGNYTVRLDIIERGTGNLFFTKLLYNLDLRDSKQPFIYSPDVVVKGEIVKFGGMRSYLPGFQILDYSWDFGDGSRSVGVNASHLYKEKGNYIVNLELTLKSDSTRRIHKTGISKKIAVLNDPEEKSSFMALSANVKTTIPDIRNYENARIWPQYSAETDFQQDAVFALELLSSKAEVGLKSSIFRNVPKKYTIKEKFDPETGIYSYIVDQQMNLMEAFPAYKELLALGFTDVKVKMFILKDQAEKELHELIKTYGALADTYFDSSDKLTANAFIMLDQIVKLMNKYPALRLQVAVHSDNTGVPEKSMDLSQIRSQLLVNYLINRGINVNRLVATGFGVTKPVAPNFIGKYRKLNRRIDFIIIN